VIPGHFSAAKSKKAVHQKERVVVCGPHLDREQTEPDECDPSRETPPRLRYGKALRRTKRGSCAHGFTGLGAGRQTKNAGGVLPLRRSIGLSRYQSERRSST
jgi:hypothetical protein